MRPRSLRQPKHQRAPDQSGETQIIAALASGQHADSLGAIFGDEYAALHTLARRSLQPSVLAKTQKSPRVYVVPGIMGSTLGLRGAHEHSLWFNPQAIASGALLTLSLPSRRVVHATGVMLPGYLKLLLQLRAGGWDAVFYPFDWRKSIVESGAQFAQRIASDAARDVVIVAHSMGGLVARVALARDTAKRIQRIVQLGTPNYGSFALVQALRGVYPTVRKVTALDRAHSTDQITRHVFRSFPGLYEMLPAASRTAELDMHNLANWPRDLLGPDATLLASAAHMRSRLGSARAGCFHIVGVNQETVTRIRLRGDEFHYGITHDGDGTVPRVLAEWPGAQTLYAAEKHGALTHSDSVCRAVIELIDKGTTKRLSAQNPTLAAEPIRWVSDTELRRASVGSKRNKVLWDSLSLDERRRILEPTLTAAFKARAHR